MQNKQASGHKKRFAVVVIATMLALGVAAMYGLQQAQIQASSPFQVDSAGAITYNWSACSLRLDGHTCQVPSGTIWKVYETSKNETFAVTVPVASLYLTNITSYTQVIQPCNFNASGVGPAPYFVPQWYVNGLYKSLNSLESQAASAKSSTAYYSATQQIYTVEQTIQSTCAPQSLGAYKNTELTVEVGIVNDPLTGQVALSGALDPQYNTTALANYNVWAPQHPSDRQVTITVTATYIQTSVYRDGQVYQTVIHNFMVKHASWRPAA